MALIVEDGSGVENANSYNSEQEIRAYAEARGYLLPEEDSDLASLAVQATDYLESFREKYKGSKTSFDQELQWPRSGVIIDGHELEDNIIPKMLKQAHAQATVEAYENDLLPNSSATVKREKVDVLEVEYQDGSGGEVRFEKVETLLAPILTKKSKWPTRSKRV